jgi:outer membrane protein
MDKFTKNHSLIRASCLLLMISLVAVSSFGMELGITIADARQRAVLYNRRFLSAKEEINKASAQIAQAKAGAFPDITAAGSWDHNFKVPSMLLQMGDQTEKIKIGANNSFGASVTLSQPIWTGGKVFSAISIAKLYRDYTADNARQAEDEIKYNADILFYAAILQRANLDVLNKSLEATTKNLEVAEKLYSKGMVSEYELLRARVERANLLPAIYQGESDLKLAEKRLKSFIGLNLGDTTQLIEEPDDTSLVRLPALSELTKTALEKRPELMAAEHLRKISKKSISVARADYQPTLGGYANWSWQAQSDQFRLDKNNTTSATAGLSLSIPIFKGGRVGGDVAYRQAEYRQTTFAEEQLRDDIALEVEEAHDRLIQAKKSLDAQKETIAQAEEGQRIANLRYEQGVGTQLEVLSSQAALTQARQAHAIALFQFRQAKAGLKKATTIDLDAK